MTKYRLNRAEKVQVTVNNVAKTRVMSDGRKVVSYSNYIRLAPNTVYETDDEAMLDFFRNYKARVRYRTELEANLRANGVPYEIEICRSCGGKIKKLKYQLVEVLDNEE